MLLVVGCSSVGFQPLNRSALRLTNPRSVSAPRLVAAFVSGVDSYPDEVADPAISIRASVVAALAQRFALEVLDPDARADTTAGQADRRASQADLILEVRTIHWKVSSNPRPRVWYDGTLRLTDARTNRVVAEGVCTSHPVTRSPRDNHAALDQGEMDDTVDLCVDDYRHRVLGLY